MFVERLTAKLKGRQRWIPCRRSRCHFGNGW